MKKRIIACILAISAVCLLASCSNTKTAKLDPKNPTTITVWHYYNGDQQKSFNDLVEKFNQTQGKEEGIVVEASSQGGVKDLESNVLDAADGKVGASEVPNIFAAYSDTAYAIDRKGLVADLSPYFSKKELNQYIESYIEEGRFSNDDSLKIFPIAKSTEIFMINKTDWDKFANATGADIAQLNTLEGVAATAEAYYDWTDSQTPAANDGKAFFGRDAMANYFIIGAKQLGIEIFSLKDGKPVLNFDKEVVKKLWDNYYIPYVKGYFSAFGRFRSDDIKTGNIISFVGSSSGASFFPKEVITDDEDSYPIDMEVYQAPQFEGGEKYAVQQGAGMVVTKASDEEVYASVEFLKWFTNTENNIDFSLASGYLPVTKDGNDRDALNLSEQSDKKTAVIVSAAIETVQDNTLYTTKAFENGTQARDILEYSLSDKATADRKTVEANLKKGMSLKEAVSSFESNENFNDWYNKTLSQLEQLMQ
ncbi:extracellular solute-binding protein [Anaerovorax odorimutans]|uniref:Extracellular solute-binding protein n=1 Tax=Anaerovorax odorimutans TaxID=109327 RepID=A0ABT1RR23_9FIRM|nr:extracellular solute-binding protein [Anaerovorax odorimutans]MCQ4637648.1 extracellular solute-binding protein [Anaerovorax odorimutans]